MQEGLERGLEPRTPHPTQWQIRETPQTTHSQNDSCKATFPCPVSYVKLVQEMMWWETNIRPDTFPTLCSAMGNNSNSRYYYDNHKPCAVLVPCGALRLAICTDVAVTMAQQVDCGRLARQKEYYDRGPETRWGQSTLQELTTHKVVPINS